jgi:hypothetical protein
MSRANKPTIDTSDWEVRDWCERKVVAEAIGHFLDASLWATITDTGLEIEVSSDGGVTIIGKVSWNMLDMKDQAALDTTREWLAGYPATIAASDE